MRPSPHFPPGFRCGGGERVSFAPLSIRQPAAGYRFNGDSVLLADFAVPWCGRSVLDLGTGSGVVLLLLARLSPSLERGVGVEIQRELFGFARRNIEENGLAGRLEAVRADLREEIPGLAAASFDLVVSNPPYRRVGEGRRNPDPQKEIARHEVKCTMADLVRAARRHLAPGGRFATLGLPRRLPELLALAAAGGMAAETIRFVHPFPGRPASLFLTALRRRRTASLEVLPPLFLHAGKGRRSAEAERIFRGLAGA